jgi:PGF-pre-PGF domain-containing protein
VNVGGGSAVTRAEMTGTSLGKNLVITGMQKSVLPATMAAPNTTVFQYISITTSTIPGVINQTLLDFSVPQSWLTGNGFAASDIVMMHYVDGQWQTLDTRYVSQKDGDVMYQATMPGFSYFAIAYQKGGTLVGRITPVQTESAVAETPVTSTVSSGATITTRQTQKVAATAPTAAPVEGTPLTTIITGVIGVIAIIAGAILVRRWLIRRQNPALLRRYD